MDSSVTPARVYSAETIKAIRRVLESVVAHGAWVPALWRLEVVNVLEMCVRSGSTNTEFRDGALSDLALLPITADYEAIGTLGEQRRGWRAALASPSTSGR